MDLARVFIHNAQRPVTTAFERGVMDEVPRPDVTSTRCLLRVLSSGDPPAALFLLGWRNLQTFLATHLAHPLAAYTQSTVPHQPTHLVRTKFGVFYAQINDGVINRLLLNGRKLRTITQC